MAQENFLGDGYVLYLERDVGSLKCSLKIYTSYSISIIPKFKNSSQKIFFELVLKKIRSLTGQAYFSYYLGGLLKSHKQKACVFALVMPFLKYTSNQSKGKSIVIWTFFQIVSIKIVSEHVFQPRIKSNLSSGFYLILLTHLKVTFNATDKLLKK